MMKNPNFDQAFWSSKYQEGQTGWDMGEVSPPIKAYIDQLKYKDISILIPGAGNAYEAAYLFEQGFTDVTVLDLAKEPLDNFKKRMPDFPMEKLIQQDFFNHEGQYDLILEQTFFCALDPSLRMNYINKMKSLLKLNGKLSGLLFDFRLSEEGPPFGGDADAYSLAFQEQFYLKTLSPCYNSIKPRAGKELFIIFEKTN